MNLFILTFSDVIKKGSIFIECCHVASALHELAYLILVTAQKVGIIVPIYQYGNRLTLICSWAQD